MRKQVIIHHSADFDGLFSREIAKKFLPEAEVIGWDFKDKPLNMTDFQDKDIWILDLPVDQTFGFDFAKTIPFEMAAFLKSFLTQIVWIDHHKTSIESHPSDIRGYRIDGVAACRLAWQWFTSPTTTRPVLADYGMRKADGTRTEYKVQEPLAVKLAGQYDIWDKETPDVDTFQYGLKAQPLDEKDWAWFLDPVNSLIHSGKILRNGKICQAYQENCDAEIVGSRSFLTKWEGLTFLTMTSAKCSSLTFASKDKPETGHDALMAFFYDGSKFRVSLYHASHRKDLDLSAIAKKHGGGGHRGACGFAVGKLPFVG